MFIKVLHNLYIPPFQHATMFKRRRPQEEKEQPQAPRISNDLDDAPPANDSDDASSSIGVPSGSASSNPILLVKMVMRRVLTLIITDDDRRGYSPVRVMKDIFVGLIWGLFIIVCLIFLDCEFMFMAVCFFYTDLNSRVFIISITIIIYSTTLLRCEHNST